LQQITLTQTITKVEALIDTGKGDSGRLSHILEFLKNSRALYYSDQTYLEKKLNSSFSVEEELILENTLLPKVQDLINSGNGDPGRLQHIYDMLENNKPLYSSDHAYLESKLYPSIKEPNIVQVVSPKQEQVKKYIPPPEEFPKKPESKPVSKGILPKGWSPENNSKELEQISKNIKDEQQKIEKQQKISDELNMRRTNLTELTSQRKEFEQKVTQDRSSLESQIKDERLRIEIQTKSSKEISIQKEELDKIKKEKENIIKNIDSEKTKISKELVQQKNNLQKLN
jgi:hypothetical protein